MKETLITFETAELAKEKGFDIPVRNYVALSDKSKSIYEGFDDDYWGDNRIVNWNNGMPLKPFGEGLSIPTQSLLQKWLREVHRADITVITDWIKGERVYYVGFSFVNPNNEIDIWFSNDNENRKVKYLSYEGALEIGLQEALKKMQS